LSLAWKSPPNYLIAFGLALAIWSRVRKQRLAHWQVGALEYEELADPAVHSGLSARLPGRSFDGEGVTFR
jgi:hypothetical protein